MDDPGLGLSPASTAIVYGAFTILTGGVAGMSFLIIGNFISPMMYAILAATAMAILVIVIVYVVVREEGWESIFPP